MARVSKRIVEWVNTRSVTNSKEVDECKHVRKYIGMEDEKLHMAYFGPLDDPLFEIHR